MKARKIPDEIVFNRPKKFKYIREIGEGACGQTILIKDVDMDTDFVAKKYSPIPEIIDDPACYLDFFKRFREEAKILFKLNHPNVVRVYNFFEYEEHRTAYIIMEHIAGKGITEFLCANPADAAAIFNGLIDGFSYLESKGILHRDIRPANILIDHDRKPKIIDFGFGKEVGLKNDNLGKSISLNWWCEPPSDFDLGIYDFATEVYFVGQLFRESIHGLGLEEFPHRSMLNKMCSSRREIRPHSFSAIKMELSKTHFDEISFTDSETSSYRNFSEELLSIFSTIGPDAEIVTNAHKIIPQMKNLLMNNMLEENLSVPIKLARIFVKGDFRYWINRPFSVASLKDFTSLLETLSTEKRSIAISNLASRLEAIRTVRDNFDDDIPF